MFRRLAILSLISIGVCARAAPPDCASAADGLYADEENCAGYYECAGGTLSSQDCPFGLFFNSAARQCDWALRVSCQLTRAQVEAIRIPETVFLYYTVDDFPSYNYGSDKTLDALRDGNVQATFMANSDVLTWGDIDYKENSVLRALLEGHLIGDHSYDHMGHNNPDGGGVYDDVDVDLSYFGQINLDPILAIMDKYGFPQTSKDELSAFFLQWARLPNDNNWRITNIVRDSCDTCAPPPTSTLAAMQVADRLLADYGTNVVGWDLPFFTDYANHRYQYNAVQMIMNLLSWPGHQRNKLIILDHTFMHDFGEDYGQENYNTLVEFFELAKQVGFVFRRMDTYLTD